MDIEMMLIEGKIYFEAESLCKWLAAANKNPELKKFAVLLKQQADLLKKKVGKG